MKKINNPPQSLREVWRKNFIYDTQKFIKSSFLSKEDLDRTFEFNGETWKIIGSMEGKEMTCEKLESGEVFIWDRWKVSSLLHPDVHAKANMKVEMVYPKKKERKKKAEEEKPKQLNMFDDL